LTRYANRTVRSIIRKMAQARYISGEARDQALGSRLPFEKVPEEEEMQVDEAGVTNLGEEPNTDNLTPEESGLDGRDATEL
jgi:membrane peptidoglycan carboxypeptidase